MTQHDDDKPEDYGLWHEVAKTVTPLRPGGEKELSSDTGKQRFGKKTKVPDKRPSCSLPKSGEQDRKERPAIGSGMDRRTRQRLQRGQLPLEGKLDLHGMTRAAAQAALDRFLHKAWEDGKRTVLVVTGKGSRSKDKTGILKNKVPQWLKETPLNRIVLAYKLARPKDGGEGALYIRLRRRRER